MAHPKNKFERIVIRNKKDKRREIYMEEDPTPVKRAVKALRLCKKVSAREIERVSNVYAVSIDEVKFALK